MCRSLRGPACHDDARAGQRRGVPAMLLLTMTTRRTARQYQGSTTIQASPAAVWRALTEPQELTNWFPLHARVVPRAGGTITLSWGPPWEGTAPITIWEPQRRLQWREEVSVGGKPSPILVDFRLEPRGHSTELQLTHSGIGADAAWDDYFESITSGWSFELFGLKHYLEVHPGVRRQTVWVRRRSQRQPKEFLPELLGPKARVLRGEVEGLKPGDRYSLTVTGSPETLTGTVAINALPKLFCGELENLNRGLLRVEWDRSGGAYELWVWLSLYNLPAATVNRLRDTLDAAADRLAGCVRPDAG
ncbi:MAG: hypothetical protein Kow001_14230 [Acidobacteriota bacterium]